MIIALHCLPDSYVKGVVVVIVYNEHWEQGIQIELTCITKLFPCSPNQCQHHLNYILIPCPDTELFHSDCLSELPI